MVVIMTFLGQVGGGGLPTKQKYFRYFCLVFICSYVF